MAAAAARAAVTATTPSPAAGESQLCCAPKHHYTSVQAAWRLCYVVSRGVPPEVDAHVQAESCACRDSHRDGTRGGDRNKRESSAERRAKIAAWNKERKGA